MRVALISREYPPEVYGGAGVHIEFLTRELRRLIDVDVHCFGAERAEPGVHAYHVPDELAAANAALGVLGVDIEIAAGIGASGGGTADVVHSHTWYANLAGHMSGLLYEIPHVVTAHSLEPLRPWKADQLGGGYLLSSWAERTAYLGAAAVIAVSRGMAADVLAAYPGMDPARLHVIPNGIDTEMYAPTPSSGFLDQYGVNGDAPVVLFVGRITKQKGVAHLVAAARDFDPTIQLVLCAGSPDTPELAAELAAAISELQSRRRGVVWIQQMLPRRELIQLLSAADVFVCPSIYEPQGIVNLEAMACETAVVASRVGGIPDVVIDGETGLLVDYPGETEAAAFHADLAAAVNELVRDPERARRMGLAGRDRAVIAYSWQTIASQTVELYESLG